MREEEVKMKLIPSAKLRSRAGGGGVLLQGAVRPVRLWVLMNKPAAHAKPPKNLQNRRSRAAGTSSLKQARQTDGRRTHRWEGRTARQGSGLMRHWACHALG